MLNKEILLNGTSGNKATLTVAYSESAWWPSGHFLDLYDQSTGEQLIQISREPQQVKVALGQELYIKATASSIGHPDRVDGAFTIESSTGVTFTNIPSERGSNLEFYITGVNASFTFTYG